MPTTDPTYGWPLPVAADPPDGPGQITALAAGIATDLSEIDTALPFRTWTWEGSAAFNSGDFSISHPMGAEAVWVGVMLHDASTAITLCYIDTAGFSTVDVRAWVSSTGALFTGAARIGIIGFWNRP
jgi:hypothetical protein